MQPQHYRTRVLITAIDTHPPNLPNTAIPQPSSIDPKPFPLQKLLHYAPSTAPARASLPSSARRRNANDTEECLLLQTVRLFVSAYAVETCVFRSCRREMWCVALFPANERGAWAQGVKRRRRVRCALRRRVCVWPGKELVRCTYIFAWD
ncbi:hypothetical protein P171DRAFT_72226 [Karstenula rhodostoma CBS 690.94]|uniref:Uncharacterized protein n=1 Tax=Karstenula rhodostoma CBS 690.94 TaxID=1392251 RepID=A0A9P4PE03_9PLEO|nr:hypothetical protein P171DRAFT_72226 [Karstenula rhodostoma CBS 690.94]